MRNSEQIFEDCCKNLTDILSILRIFFENIRKFLKFLENLKFGEQLKSNLEEALVGDCSVSVKENLVIPTSIQAAMSEASAHVASDKNNSALHVLVREPSRNKVTMMNCLRHAIGRAVATKGMGASAPHRYCPTKLLGN